MFRLTYALTLTILMLPARAEATPSASSQSCTVERSVPQAGRGRRGGTSRSPLCQDRDEDQSSPLAETDRTVGQ